MSRALLIRQALVLPGGGDWKARRADILIEADRIAQLGAVERAGDARVIDGAALLAAPGLVNAHYHSPLSILRGTADGFSHPAFMWQNQADTASRTAHEVYVSALLGGVEMLASGTTAAIDHFPEQGFPLEHVDAAARAYRELGMRAAIALRVFDEAYDDILPPGGLPPALARANPLAPAPLAETMALVEAAVERHDDPSGLLRVFPAPSNPSRCSDALLVACEELARRRSLGVHTHLLETEVQTRIAQQRYGTTMVRPLTPAARGATNHVGEEFDFTITYQPLKFLSLWAGYSHFFAGNYLKATGASDDADYGYVQATINF